MEVPLNPKINSLSPYPFSYLSELLKDSKSGRNEVINLSIGEPQNKPPVQALNILNSNLEKFPKI